MTTITFKIYEIFRLVNNVLNTVHIHVAYKYLIFFQRQRQICIRSNIQSYSLRTVFKQLRVSLRHRNRRQHYMIKIQKNLQNIHYKDYFELIHFYLLSQM